MHVLSSTTAAASVSVHVIGGTEWIYGRADVSHRCQVKAGLRPNSSTRHVIHISDVITVNTVVL